MIKTGLKFRITYNIVMILTGIIAFIYSFSCEGYKAGFLLGFGSSLFILSIIKLIRNLKIRFNKEKYKKLLIKENDERNIKISMTSLSLTFRIVLLLEVVAIIISVFLAQNIALIISVIMYLQMILYYIIYVIISKRI